MPFIAPALPFLAKAAPVVASLVTGRAKGRHDEADAQLEQDKLRLQAERNRQDAAQFNRDTPRLRQQDIAQGELASNLQDFSLGGEGRNLRSTGGLRPSVFAEGGPTRRGGAEMSRNALLTLLGRDQAIAEGRYGPNEQNPVFQHDPYGRFNADFQPTPLPKSGLLDKILGGIGIGGGALEAMGLVEKYGRRAPSPDGDSEGYF